VRERSLAEMGLLLSQALEQFPGLRFASTAEIARALAQQDPQWIHTSVPARLAICLQRLRGVPRLGRLMRWTGLGWVAQRLSKSLVPAHERGGRGPEAVANPRATD